jgi:hypothetical protein
MVEAARLERQTNLAQEEYMLLFRQALVGPGSDCPIWLPEDDGCAFPARIFHVEGQFWLERLTDQLDVAVDGHHLSLRELVPLAVGQPIVIGSSRLQVCDPEQDLRKTL